MEEKRYKRPAYQYGSEARKYASATQPNRQPNIETPPIVRRREKTDWRFGIKIGCCAAVVFATTFCFIYTCSTLSAKQQELKGLQNELRTAKSNVTNLESIISENLNLDHIQQRALEELGMREPLPHQIVYVELPKESYTIYQN